jgi:hypothetical protein
MVVQPKFTRAPASYSPTKPARIDDPENLVFLAFDPRSSLNFLQRLGLMLWLGESGRDGLWL